VFAVSLNDNEKALCHTRTWSETAPALAAAGRQSLPRIQPLMDKSLRLVQQHRSMRFGASQVPLEAPWV